MSGNEKREREMLETPLSEESTTQKKSKLKMPFREAKNTQRFKVLTLFFWCSEQGGSVIGKGAPREAEEPNLYIYIYICIYHTYIDKDICIYI